VRASSDASQRIYVGEIFQETFRIESVLGEGGMGKVFAAHDLNLDRPVAIKLLHGTFDNDEAFARFLREAKVTARLASEHTVRIYALGYDAKGSPYIVMERVSGRTLDAVVAERGPLPWEEAIAVMRQVGTALAEAHGYGIVHRDVKPGNILLEERGPRGPRVKVVDFGVAKARPHGEDRSGLTSISALLGTPEYMAPEQLHSAREVDPRADLWGLGATLYFMLVGRPPFDGASLHELLENIQHATPTPVRAHRPDVPFHVDEAIVRCLHRDPEGRFRSVDELVRALDDRLPSLVDDSDRALDEATAVTALPSEPEDEPTAIEEVTERLPSASRVPVAPAPVAPLPSGNVPAERRGARPWAWTLGVLGVGVVLGALLVLAMLLRR